MIGPHGMAHPGGVRPSRVPGYVPDAQGAVIAPPQGAAAVSREGASGQRDVGDFVPVDLAAGVEVPEAELMVADATGEGVAAVGSDREAIDGATGTVEPADLAAGVEV